MAQTITFLDTSDKDNLQQQIDERAKLTDVSCPYNFKGTATVETLPVSDNEVNDTYYCTDTKCKYTWNGQAWYQSSLNESDYEDELAELSEEIGNLTDVLVTKSPNLYNHSASETGLLNIGGNVAPTYPNYTTTDFISVEYGNEMYVQDFDKRSADNLYICEYDANKALVGEKYSVNVGLYITFGQFSVKNENAKYVRISYINTVWNGTKLMISIGERMEQYAAFGEVTVKKQRYKTPVYASVKSDVLRVITKYTKNTDLCVTFGKHGGNNLPDFMSLATINNSKEYPENNYNNCEVFLNITTDWHAPFMVKALSDIDGDQPTVSHFTGGNHNYSNTGTIGYTPTAICDDLKYYVDNVETSDFEGYCNRVEVIWVNRVQATNTKKEDGTGRFVLKEKHVLRFDGCEWESYVEIIPLEDVNLVTYYGYQAQTGNVYPNIRFIGAENRGLYHTSANNTSGDNKVSGVRVYGEEHKIEIRLDTTYDIGDRRFYTGTSGAFNTAAKIYFTLMNNINQAAENNLYCAKATYKFSHV